MRHRRHPRRTAARGLTLIELLLLLALAGAAVVALLKLMSPASRLDPHQLAARQMGQQMAVKALDIAQAVLDALPSVPAQGCAGTAAGQAPVCDDSPIDLGEGTGWQADPGYSATLAVNARHEPAARGGKANTRLVTVTVTAPDGIRVSLSALRPVGPAMPVRPGGPVRPVQAPPASAMLLTPARGS